MSGGIRQHESSYIYRVTSRRSGLCRVGGKWGGRETHLTVEPRACADDDAEATAAEQRV